jgi:FMN phosphatase YigB (HAD superfamily)
MGYPPMSRNVHLKNWGQPINIAVLERFPGIDSNEFYKIQKNMYKERILENNFERISTKNIECLKQVKKMNLVTAVLTSRMKSEFEHILNPSHPLHGIVDNFYYNENCPYHKPDPRVFDQILDHFSVKKSESLHMSDTISDCLCTNMAGIKFMAVLESGLRKRKDFAEVKVDYFADDFTEIISVLKLEKWN